MDIIGLIAIIILIAAIVFLIYYYIDSTNGGNFDFKEVFNNIANGHSSGGSVHMDDELKEKVSVGDKIKYTFKDIDKSYANTTDAFSKRLDAFLDEKSEELIQNWSLVTTDDLSSLEERCISACESIDDLEKRFSEYSNVTNERLENLDSRIKAIENAEEIDES